MLVRFYFEGGAVLPSGYGMLFVDSKLAIDPTCSEGRWPTGHHWYVWGWARLHLLSAIVPGCV